MADGYISGMTAAGTLLGDELLEVSQVSSTVKITAATLSAQASDNSYSDSGNGFLTAGFAVGNRVRVTGFTGNVANNIVAGVITAVTAGKMTIGGTDGDVIVDDAAGETVTIAKWGTRRTSLAEVIAALATGYTDEKAQDALAAAFAAGTQTGLTIVYDDANNKFTFAVAAVGGAAVSSQTGTSYTAVIGDANSYIRFSNAAAQTFTIPPNSSVAFPVGTVIEIEQAGAGALSVAAGSGVTLNSRAADLTLAGQYAVAFVKKVATDTWTLNGDL